MTGVDRGPAYPGTIGPQASLVDLLDRLLAGGVVLSGELVLTIADVPLVRIDLRALIAPAEPPPRARVGRALEPAAHGELPQADLGSRTPGGGP